MLDCGTGQGWEAAVFAAFVAPHGGRVVSIELDPIASRLAGPTIAEVRPDLSAAIELRQADMWSYAPPTPDERYDAIIVTGEVDSVPDHLIPLLRPRGRLVYVQRHPECCGHRCSQLRLTEPRRRKISLGVRPATAEHARVMVACMFREERPATEKVDMWTGLRIPNPECMRAQFWVAGAGGADPDPPNGCFPRDTANWTATPVTQRGWIVRPPTRGPTRGQQRAASGAWAPPWS